MERLLWHDYVFRQKENFQNELETARQTIETTVGEKLSLGERLILFEYAINCMDELEGMVRKQVHGCNSFILYKEVVERFIRTYYPSYSTFFQSNKV